MGAKVAGRSDPLVFETEQAIALAVGSKLAEVVTLWPGTRCLRGSLRGRASRRRRSRSSIRSQPVPHELYLAHDGHFALAGTQHGRGAVRARDAGRTAPLDVVWEYWDGDDLARLQGVRRRGIAGYRCR